MAIYSGAVCSICGAPISDNNSEGIGYECKAALKEAKSMVFFANDENRLNLYIIEVSVFKAAFIERFKDTKFRSEFKKSFYTSICQAERVSKKQLDIIKQQISYDNDLFFKVSSKVSDEKKDFIRNGISEIKVTREQIEIARKKIRKN